MIMLILSYTESSKSSNQTCILHKYYKFCKCSLNSSRGEVDSEEGESHDGQHTLGETEI